MNSEQDITFEISDQGNFVRLQPIELINHDSDLDWDKNWIKTKVILNAGNFTGHYDSEFMTTDFEKFKQELFQLYNNLKGTAHFKDLEGYLNLKVIGDGLGHFEVKIEACDSQGINSSHLIFSLTFDQTLIKDLVHQLQIITSNYPIEGDFKIQNKSLKFAQ
ncbi:WapI family immunity protein [Gracilimonas amylolytica]|uniref:WapI family immunity protein n=1 Tax=Gracilimonas amylolytica TaxID=1749045 RepID=UPI000CD8EB6B|nr:hypothetical protein [Gracilimonas amylolytica]